MTNEETIKQLEDLREHCREMIDEKDEDRNVWKDDVQALDIAIEKLNQANSP